MAPLHCRKHRPDEKGIVTFIRILAKSFNLNRNELEKLRGSDRQNYIKTKEQLPVHHVPVLNSISAGELLEWGDQEYPSD